MSLRNNIDIISNLNLDITNIPNVQYSKTKGINNLILHLADMHIGAKVESGSLYPNTWNKEELNKDAYICPGLGDAGDRIFGTL